MIKITLEGENQFNEEIERLHKFPQRLLAHTAQHLFDESFKGADKHTDTGALIRSLGSGPIPWGEGYKIEHDDKVAPYAKFVHWGTKPHKIKPKDKKALRWASGGGFNFSKGVNHPGYKGDPWMEHAIRNTDQDFDRIVANTKRELDL